jgi:sterol desaturase/sphingolipid hydroxylase (fatty acid hydroxylase superfamily)
MLSELFDYRGLLLIVLIFVPLEQLLPLHREQRIFRAGWLTDVAYVLFNGLLIRAGLLAVVLGTVALSAALLPVSVRESVRAAPVWLQVLALLIVADLCFYAVHRAFHSFPTLWKFHVIHHSISEMDWLAAHRVHPVDQIVTKGASLIPCFALGFDTLAIGVWAAMYQWQALLIHSNTRIKFGPLRWLVASPEFHHWHHGNHEEAVNKNFAGQLPFWDVLFGTLYMPKDRRPEQYGVNEHVPDGFVSQIMHPFKGQRKPTQGLGAERTEGD